MPNITKALARVGDGRNEIKWGKYNIKKHVEPPTFMSGGTYGFMKKIANFYYGDQYDSLTSVSPFTEFRRSSTLPSSDIEKFRIDDDENGTPIYVWKNSQDPNGLDLLYYCESEKIYTNQYSNNMFQRAEYLSYIDTTGWDTSNTTNFSNMFMRCGVNADTFDVDISNFDFTNATTIDSLFDNCVNIKNVPAFTITNKCTAMHRIFRNCDLLTTLDLSNWDTSNTTYMFEAFYGCNNLEYIKGLENFDTSNITSLGSMFQDCHKLQFIDPNGVYNNGNPVTECQIKHWNTSKSTSFSRCFYNIGSETSPVEIVDIDWDLSNSIQLTEMFYGSKINNLTISNRCFNTSKVKYFSSMFRNAKISQCNVEFNPSLLYEFFDTSAGENFSYMFYSINNSTIPYNLFGISNVSSNNKWGSNAENPQNINYQYMFFSASSSYAPVLEEGMKFYASQSTVEDPMKGLLSLSVTGSSITGLYAPMDNSVFNGSELAYIFYNTTCDSINFYNSENSMSEDAASYIGQHGNYLFAGISSVDNIYLPTNVCDGSNIITNYFCKTYWDNLTNVFTDSNIVNIYCSSEDVTYLENNKERLGLSESINIISY